MSTKAPKARPKATKALDQELAKACERIEEVERGDHPSNRLLYVEAYCRSTFCCAREVEILLKDYDREAVGLMRRSGFKCPVCGEGSLTVHNILTARGKSALDAHEARMSVNRQMLARDREGEGRHVFFSGPEFCDDRLPPTPPGWFDKEDRS